MVMKLPLTLLLLAAMCALMAAPTQDLTVNLPLGPMATSLVHIRSMTYIPAILGLGSILLALFVGMQTNEAVGLAIRVVGVWIFATIGFMVGLAVQPSEPLSSHFAGIELATSSLSGGVFALISLCAGLVARRLYNVKRPHDPPSVRS